MLSASASTLNGGRNGQRAAPPVLELNSSRQAIRLGGYWAMLQDPSAALTFKEILSLPRAGAFVPLAANSLSLGYTESAVWLHFRVRNAAPAVIDWLLEVDYPLLDRIDVYSRHEHHDGWHLTTIGDRLPFSQRPLPHRSFLLPLEVREEGVTEYYLRVVTESSLQFGVSIQPAACRLPPTSSADRSGSASCLG